jgi:hypothetical protein
MSLQIKATGTIKELEVLWEWDVLCQLIHVDYYNKHLVPPNEIFTVTEKDFK